MMQMIGTNDVAGRQAAYEFNTLLVIAVRMGRTISAHQQLALHRGHAESTSFERIAHIRFCSMCFQLCSH